MSAFANMKKKRMSFESLAKKFENDKGKSFQKDERFYYPNLDENKSGQAIIRFLPETDGESIVWAKTYYHGFKAPNGQWYIENCPTTAGLECPMCKANSEIVAQHGGWDTCPDSAKTLIRQRKRRLQYISNILVVEDKKNPELEGKVMLFKFGAKIFDMLKSAMNPEFDGEVAIIPFDFWEGANFRLRIRKVDGMVNYGKSEFAEVSPVAKTDKAIEEIWKQQTPLAPFMDGENAEMFKTQEQLQKQVARVLGQEVSTPQPAAQAPVHKTAPVVETAADASEDQSSDETDEAMDYFRKMAEED